MKVYRLDVAEVNDKAFATSDEWFASLSSAIKRRRELVVGGKANEFGDFEIDCVVFARISPLRLLLAVLNGKSWAKSIDQVVEPYVPPRQTPDKQAKDGE